MKQVESYEALTAKTAAFFGRGMVTNCFLAKEILCKEITEGNLFFEGSEGALFLFRRRDTHWQMYFYMADGAALPELPDVPFVNEIAFRTRDTALQTAAERLQNAGMQCLCKRHRRKRTVGSRPIGGTAEFAQSDDLDEVLSLLKASFSSLTGCLPTRDELLDDIRRQEVLINRRNKKIAGILHLQYAKPAFDLRHLATDAACRGQGVASELLQSFFSLPDARGYRVWVVDSNVSAERLYEKHGFTKDGYFSLVLGNLTDKEA